jgi:hypothetical protein
MFRSWSWFIRQSFPNIFHQARPNRLPRLPFSSNELWQDVARLDTHTQSSTWLNWGGGNYNIERTPMLSCCCWSWNGPTVESIASFVLRMKTVMDRCQAYSYFSLFSYFLFYFFSFLFSLPHPAYVEWGRTTKPSHSPDTAYYYSSNGASLLVFSPVLVALFSAATNQTEENGAPCKPTESSRPNISRSVSPTRCSSCLPVESVNLIRFSVLAF